MQRIIPILMFLLLTETLVAQDLSFEHPIEKTKTFGINIFIGGQFSNLNELNRILKAEGIHEVSPQNLLIGGGMNFIYGRHFLHFMGSATLNEKSENSTIRTSAWGFGVGINYGYKFYFGPVYAIPYTGISRDGLFIEIQDLPTNNTTINNQIVNRNISKLHNEVLAATVGCRLLIPDDWETMLTGIDLSYQMPLKSNWFNGDFSTTNEPKINIGGFKVGIEILLIKGN